METVMAKIESVSTIIDELDKHMSNGNICAEIGELQTAMDELEHRTMAVEQSKNFVLDEQESLK